MITIKEALTKKEMTEFVKFPFSLYKDNKYWVPPIIADELASFDRTKNPAFESAEAYFYLAYKNNEIVGRIAAIINWGEVKNQNKKKVRFGWFDVIDDIEVTKALLEKGFKISSGSIPRLINVLILFFSLFIESMKVFIPIFIPVIALPIIIPAKGIVY
jgi:hypothetical protein